MWYMQPSEVRFTCAGLVAEPKYSGISSPVEYILLIPGAKRGTVNTVVTVACPMPLHWHIWSHVTARVGS